MIARHPSLIIHLSSFRPARAFTLLELMIAIVVLGIGMVMVATVFPVGLEIAGETLQMNISQQVVDSAMATLSVKVPPRTDFDGNPGTAYARVLVPDVAGTDGDAYIEPADFEVLDALHLPGSNPDIPVAYDNWLPEWPAVGSLPKGPRLIPGQGLVQFFQRARVFTEVTGWAAELNSWNDASVVPSQNLPLDSSGRIPTVVPPAFGTRSALPRVHLADQVYPPVSIEFEPGRGWVDPATDLVIPSDALGAFVAARAAERRYSWTAIHHRVSSQPNIRDLLVTIVVTHRADLNARYARQADTLGTGLFFNVNSIDPSNPADPIRQALVFPGADTVDRVFPEPWLVMLNQIVLSTGRVSCTNDVARLLPAGSSFIIARTSGTLFAGTAHEVLSATFDPAAIPDPGGPDNPSATLQIARGGSGTPPDVLVWVFPPPYDRSSGMFRTRSPVVGLALRRVAVE